MDASITIDVQDYRLAFPNGQSTFVLQSPVQHDGARDGAILVRQDQGANSNEVSFKRPSDLVKTDGLPHSALIHGILLRSDAARRGREGDPVWLRDTAWRPGSSLERSKIGIVNLRTWETLTVALQDVCWVPKYRKLDHRDGEEEVLTVSGAPKRHPTDKKLHVQAILQRLQTSGQHMPLGHGSRLEVREFVQQELWNYKNLGTSADGRSTAQKLYRQAFEDMKQPPPSAFSLLQQPFEPGPPEQMPRFVRVAWGSAWPTPPTDEDDDPDFEQDAQELWDRGMANLYKRPPPVVQQTQPRWQTCDLRTHRYPTPPHSFSLDQRPLFTNLFPPPHHECPASGIQDCAFPLPPVQPFLLPGTIGRTCSVSGAWPLNEGEEEEEEEESLVDDLAVGLGAGAGYGADEAARWMPSVDGEGCIREGLCLQGTAGGGPYVAGSGLGWWWDGWGWEEAGRHGGLNVDLVPSWSSPTASSWASPAETESAGGCASDLCSPRDPAYLCSPPGCS